MCCPWLLETRSKAKKSSILKALILQIQSKFFDQMVTAQNIALSGASSILFFGGVVKHRY